MTKMKTLFRCLLLGIVALESASAQVAKLPTQWTQTAMKAEVPFPEYPRPQLRRKDWMCLNGKWDYAGGPHVASAQESQLPIAFNGKIEQILVPYCPESVLSGIERKQEINMWYRRTVEIPASWNGKLVILHFDAVDHDATVFVNGQKVGTHAGGYDAFSINITPFLKAGANTLVVAAHDPNDGRTPSGKNGPRGDYTFTSGIWQTVWLEPVNKNYISNIRVTPDVANSRLKVVVNADDAQVSAVVLDGKNIVTESKGEAGNEFFIPIKNPKLWSPDDPFLYDLKLSLKDKTGAVTDEVSSYFGMREIKLGKVGGVVRPLLNSEFVMQVGLLDQGYWPDGILTAPTD